MLICTMNSWSHPPRTVTLSGHLLPPKTAYHVFMMTWWALCCSSGSLSYLLTCFARQLRLFEVLLWWTMHALVLGALRTGRTGHLNWTVLCGIHERWQEIRVVLAHEETWGGHTSNRHFTWSHYPCKMLYSSSYLHLAWLEPTTPYYRKRSSNSCQEQDAYKIGSPWQLVGITNRTEANANHRPRRHGGHASVPVTGYCRRHQVRRGQAQHGQQTRIPPRGQDNQTELPSEFWMGLAAELTVRRGKNLPSEC